jgi:DNA invertase Pin-like site-specific DNA recombinase
MVCNPRQNGVLSRTRQKFRHPNFSSDKSASTSNYEFVHIFSLDCVLKIGYARVSTLDQNKAMQLDALRAAGCERIFEDVTSGAKESRPGLDESLAFARKGDELVVWKLDRVGRSLPHLVKLMAQLGDQGIGFCSVTENIETQTPGGRLVMHMFAALAEFERDLIRERTRSGLEAARARAHRWPQAAGAG